MKRKVSCESLLKESKRLLTGKSILEDPSIPRSNDDVTLKNPFALSNSPSRSLHCISTTTSVASNYTDCSSSDDEIEEIDNKLKKIQTQSVKACDDGSITGSDLLTVTSTSCSDISVLANDGDFLTAVVFEAGLQHFDKNNRGQKERPLRVASVLDHLSQSKISDRCRYFDELPGGDELESSFLDDEDYLRVHLPGYMQRLDRISSCKCCIRLNDEAQQFTSIFFTPDSVKEAKKAATSLCQLVSNVVRGTVDNGFAVIRPPGHHAEPGMAGGFCTINNVAVAAAYAREKLNVKRVLIVDWDVHHGNGTQSIFLNDPNVLYFSVHRHEGGNYFPFSSRGSHKVVGAGEGAGYNINVGWSRKGAGDDEYLAVWETILMPVAEEFEPDLVIVSAGFDAAKGDMGEGNVTPQCFGLLTGMLMSLAGGKVVCALEGGYVRSILSKCVESVVFTLLDRQSPDLSSQTFGNRVKELGGKDVLDLIDKTAAKNIRDTIASHQPHWRCFQ